MQVEISRRKFLQGTVALSVIGGVSATSLFSKDEHPKEKTTPTTKTKTGEATEVPTLCEMCVNKCAALARPACFNKFNMLERNHHLRTN